MFRSIGLSAVAAIGFVATTAVAQDRSQYTLFDPTPADRMRSFSTDRPTKSNVPYTVDAGHIQYEGDIFIYGFDNTTTLDTDNRTWVIGNPTFKLGLLDNVDVEVNFSAFNNISSTTRSTGASNTLSGFGDTITRLKINLFGNDGSGPALALIPYGKWPTAPQGIGNRYVEGGVIVPLAVPLPLGFTGILMGEFDYQKNPNDAGYHANFPALINVSRPIVENLPPTPSSTPTGRPIPTCATSTPPTSRSPGTRGRISSSTSASMSASSRLRCRTSSTSASRSDSDRGIGIP